MRKYVIEDDAQQVFPVALVDANDCQCDRETAVAAVLIRDGQRYILQGFEGLPFVHTVH